MILYPAIDIRGGSAVRLLEGDYARETVYDADPVDAAKRWQAEGAEFLHVVDLDGAKAGEPRNLDAIERIAAAVDCPIQVGGGLRDAASVSAVLGAGAKRVVIGTAALRDPDFLKAMVDAYDDRVVVSIDSRNGEVMLGGWTEGGESGEGDAVDLFNQADVKRYLYTAIEVDGTMQGLAFDQLYAVAHSTQARVIASGGVGSLVDLESLADGAPSNVEGVIVGRALYENRFSVQEAIAALRRRPSR